ncbi:MAG: type II toxin-antitoxin system Phd/YefM family antitoxin [Senegalia sp. (in: firmicutes)]|uniref:type II toxin-antitoxin system Phd/YefM family antitoxin n=1 Tax=Senegalia sp. (in: firmicutes) TaxID=1924098 RepID=UPI003F965FA7
MPNLRSIIDLIYTTEISKLCHETNEPIFITKNGYGDMVVMSIDTYEKTLGKLELYSKLIEAEEQIKNWEEILDGESVFEKLRNKYGDK